MKEKGIDLNDQFFPYIAVSLPLAPLPVANSSSMVASLLYYAGVDIAQNMPFQFLTFTTGHHTLLGTSGDDELSIQWSFDTLLGGQGNDTLIGGESGIAIEKFYGGEGDDTFKWSPGRNFLHGGQPFMPYEDDGLDTVDYSGAGVIRIERTAVPTEHLIATFVVTHSFGIDYLYSIERVAHSQLNDTLIIGEGVVYTPTRTRVELDLGEEEEGKREDGNEGDVIDLKGKPKALLIAPSDDPKVIRVAEAVAGSQDFPTDHGIWVRSAETLIATDLDDRIYAGATLRVVVAGNGNDLVDARAVAPFSRINPEQFDAEIDGGEGDDILVSGSGHTRMQGGMGSDTFILSSLSDLENVGRRVEFVIEGGDASDKLFVPYNFLKPGPGNYENSELFQILGGVGIYPGIASFDDLPQVDASGSALLTPDAYFVPWQSMHDYNFNPNASQGILDFSGMIRFSRDQSDLLIHIFGGDTVDVQETDSDGNIYTYTATVPFFETEAIIRVKNFSEGDLGIRFYALTGEQVITHAPNFIGQTQSTVYANWDEIVNLLMNGGQLFDPLPPAPKTPIYDFPEPGSRDERERLDGTEEDDLLIASLTSGGGSARTSAAAPPTYSSGSDLYGGGGNDTLIGGDKRDRLDGGRGADVMSGGRGDDTYVVDDAADSVIELDGEGYDTAISSIDFTLPSHVDRLVLIGGAVAGTGNALDNAIEGNALDNLLVGAEGSDTLVGGRGNDRLVGGAGSDNYVYMIGDGLDVIADTGASDDIDVLFAVGVEASQVSVHISSNAADDVVLRFADGGRVTLEQFFSGQSIEIVRFDDGTRWTRADIEAAATSNGVLANDAPVARDDGVFYTYLDEIVLPARALLENDRDMDGDPLQIVAIMAETAGGLAEVTDSGDVRLGIEDGRSGLVEFTYTVSDGRGGLVTARGAMLFLKNAAPVMLNGGLVNQHSPEDELWTFQIPANLFTDPDNDPVLINVSMADGSALPAWLSYDSLTRTLSGLPPENFHGVFDLRVNGTDGQQTVEAPFRLTITPVNDAPVARDDSGFTTRANSPLIIAASALLANDSDVDGDTLTIIAVGEAQNGRAVLEADGTIRFTPAVGFVGTANFSYTVSDGNGGTAVGSVGVVVESTNSPPVAIRGTPGKDVLVGTPDRDVIDGRAGNDSIYGRGGHDTLIGGSGRDRLFGEDGDDVLRGGTGNDRLDGGSGHDRLFGEDGDDVLKGGSGNDHLDGGSGRDRLFGEDGDDVLRGGADNDRLDGGSGHDRLFGDDGADVLLGGAGNDRLDGGAGNDRLSGGEGRDVFVFRGTFGHDVITDFETSSIGRTTIDRINLLEAGLANYQELLSKMTQVGNDTLITVDEGSSIRLKGVKISQLGAEDFIL